MHRNHATTEQVAVLIKNKILIMIESKTIACQRVTVGY